MDALGESLTETFESGAKTLVFVRRVKSVDELAEKLSRRYDEWLQAELRRKLPGTLHSELDRVWRLYEKERRESRWRIQVEAVQKETGDTDGKEALLIEEEDIEDPGGNDAFLAWFFRGEGPKGLLSQGFVSEQPAYGNRICLRYFL